jgi:hypothetical protein
MQMKRVNTLILTKFFFLVILLSTFAACGRSESSKLETVTIEQGAVTRLNGCHVSMDAVNSNPKYPKPFAYLRFVCDVPESALNEKNWWGQQPQPLMLTLELGECLRLDKIFYCAKLMEPGKSATLEPRFRMKDADIMQTID